MTSIRPAPTRWDHFAAFMEENGWWIGMWWMWFFLIYGLTLANRG